MWWSVFVEGNQDGGREAEAGEGEQADHCQPFVVQPEARTQDGEDRHVAAQDDRVNRGPSHSAATTQTADRGLGPGQNRAGGNPNSPEKLVRSISSDHLRQDIEAFAAIADEHGNRAAGTPGFQASLDYAVGELEEAGYDVEEMKRRGRGRPGRGAEPMQVVAVRLTAEELAAVDAIAGGGGS